tara:strand:+ start:433 stop:1353 length:921 start_codon:yes stop_codon:yes gene_type:complete
MFDIDIHLSEEDARNSKLILNKKLNIEDIHQIKNQIIQFTEDPTWFVSSNKISRVGLFTRLKNILKNVIQDSKKIASGKIKNDQTHSKELYETLALSACEFSDMANQHFVLNQGKLASTSVYRMRSEFSKRAIEAIHQVDAKSIIEFGCGEGLLLYCILILDEKFLDQREWVGFDFSLVRAVRAKILFETLNKTKNERIMIYNGDGKNVIHQDKEFDVATCCMVIEQLKYDKHEFLREMGRVAKYSIIQEPLYLHQTKRGRIHFKRHDYVELDLKDIEKIGKIVDVKHYDLNDPTYALSTLIVENY